MSHRDFIPFSSRTTVDPRTIYSYPQPQTDRPAASLPHTNGLPGIAGLITPTDRFPLPTPSSFGSSYTYTPPESHSGSPGSFEGPLGHISLPPTHRSTYRVADFVTTSHSTHCNFPHHSPPPHHQQPPHFAPAPPWATASNPSLTLSASLHPSRATSFEFSQVHPTAPPPTPPATSAPHPGPSSAMPPTRRTSASKRIRRASNSSVAEPCSPPSGSTSSASKRQKISHDSHRRASQASVKELETVDLAADNPGEDSKDALEAVLEKQRVDAVAAQGMNQPKAVSGELQQRLGSVSCVICMDNMTDMTATSCGHVFCHTCLLHALIAGENRSTGQGETKRSQCPVCRKPLNRQKRSDIIPLLLKKGMQTQPRRKGGQGDVEVVR